MVVANHGAALPPMPQGFDVVRVDFPPNPNYDISRFEREQAYEAVRFDKGRRILAGMLSTSSAYYMVVDDDDLISFRIVEHVSDNIGRNGWRIDKGYLWSDGGRVLLPHDDFDSYCGTSLIIRSDLYGLPATIEEASADYVRTMLGSHVRIGEILERGGNALDRLPFRGAVYRLGHSGAHSGSARLTRIFWSRRALRRPLSVLRNLARLRPVGPRARREFFGDRAARDL